MALRDFFRDELVKAQEEALTAKDKTAAREKLDRLLLQMATVRPDESPRIIGLRREIEEFRKQHQGELLNGSNPGIDGQYAHLRQELAAVEWRAEQP